MIFPIYVFIVLTWFLVGFFVARYGLRVHELLLLIPVSPAIGLIIHFVISNVLLRVLPVSIAMWITLIIMLGGGSLLWFKRRCTVEPLTLDVQRGIAVVLLIYWVSTGLLFYRVSRSWENLDWVDTGPRATMYGRLGLPLLLSRSYADYQFCSYTHEAEAVMIGSLATQMNTHDLRMVNDVRSGVNMMTVVGLAFALLWLLFKKKCVVLSAVGSWLLITTGPATFLAQIHNIPILSKFLDTNSLVFVQTSYYAQSGIPFPYNVFFPLSYYMTNPYPASFLVYMLTALLAWLYIESGNYGWLAYVGLGVIVATSALFAESLFPLIAICLGVSFLYKVWKSRRSPTIPIRNLLVFTGTVVLLASLQGGVITDVLFCPKYEPPSTSLGSSATSLLSFTLNLDPAYQGAYLRSINLPTVKLRNPNDWLNVIVDWGVALILFPLVLVYALRTRLTHVALLMICAIPFVLFTFFVGYKQVILQDSVFRFAVYPLWFTGMFSVFLLRWWWNTKAFLMRIAGRLLVLLVIAALTIVGSVNTLYYAKQPQMQSSILSPIDMQVQSKWYGVLDPFQDSVFDPTQDLDGLRSLARSVMIFATYGGKRNLRANIAYNYQPELTDIRRWRETLAPEILQGLGFTYLYVDNTWVAAQSSALLQNTLYKPQYYELVGAWRDNTTGDTRQLYRILPLH